MFFVSCVYGAEQPNCVIFKIMKEEHYYLSHSGEICRQEVVSLRKAKKKKKKKKQASHRLSAKNQSLWKLSFPKWILKDVIYMLFSAQILTTGLRANASGSPARCTQLVFTAELQREREKNTKYFSGKEEITN